MRRACAARDAITSRLLNSLCDEGGLVNTGRARRARTSGSGGYRGRETVAVRRRVDVCCAARRRRVGCSQRHVSHGEAQLPTRLLCTYRAAAKLGSPSVQGSDALVDSGERPQPRTIKRRICWGSRRSKAEGWANSNLQQPVVIGLAARVDTPSVRAQGHQPELQFRTLAAQGPNCLLRFVGSRQAAVLSRKGLIYATNQCPCPARRQS